VKLYPLSAKLKNTIAVSVRI